MKIVMAIQAGLQLAKRAGIGVKDIKHLHKALKKNKEDESTTPKGEIDYVRLTGFLTTLLGLIAGLLYSFGKIDAETYSKLMEVFNG